MFCDLMQSKNLGLIISSASMISVVGCYLASFVRSPFNRIRKWSPLPMLLCLSIFIICILCLQRLVQDLVLVELQHWFQLAGQSTKQKDWYWQYCVFSCDAEALAVLHFAYQMLYWEKTKLFSSKLSEVYYLE